MTKQHKFPNLTLCAALFIAGVGMLNVMLLGISIRVIKINLISLKEKVDSLSI